MLTRIVIGKTKRIQRSKLAFPLSIKEINKQTGKTLISYMPSLIGRILKTETPVLNHKMISAT